MEKPNKSKKKMNSFNKNNEDSNIEIPKFPNELEKNIQIRETQEKLINVYEKMKIATDEYCQKIKDISKSLNPTIDNLEGKLQKIIFDLLNNISEMMKKIITKFEKKKINFSFKDMIESLRSKLDNFNKEYDEDLNILELIKKQYFDELNKYEIFIIKKELGLLESKNDNEINKKENKKKDKNTTSTDNHLKAFETQEKFIAIKSALKEKLKEIYLALNAERKLIYQSLIGNCKILYDIIKNDLNNLNEIIEEKRKFFFSENSNNLINDENINEQEIINTIFKEELYSFKFLSDDNNNTKEENEVEEEDISNRKKKKDKNENLNIDVLIGKLQESNFHRLINEIENNKIKFNKENSEKVQTLKDKNKIQSLINLIIDNPDEFDESKKNKLSSLLTYKGNQKTFMLYLNNYRAVGSFKMKQLTIEIFSDFFIYIIDFCFKNNNYKLIQIALILSSTYYYLGNKEKNNETEESEENKIYMSSQIKKSTTFMEKNFWLNYFKILVDEEIFKINNRIEQSTSEKQKKIAMFSSCFTLIKNMIDYDMEFVFINDILQEIIKEYKFTDSEKLEIINYLISENQEKSKK